MKENKMFFEEFGHEIELATQEWAIKEGLRLLGYAWYYAMPKAGTETPIVRGYFVDTAYKNMVLAYFTVKENKGKITIARAKAEQMDRHDKGKATGFKWPIKITRTKEFITKDITPVEPLYEVLLGRKIILPFQSTMKQKEWATLPFENYSGIKPTEI